MSGFCLFEFAWSAKASGEIGSLLYKENRTLKVFVSSPGDVQEERSIAQRVLRRLADQFSAVVQIEPIFWEHEPLVATQNFQEGIPSPAATNIVVCILWARIGTRLPASIHRPDGSRYDSGTQYEFEMALEGRRERGEPDLLVYRKTAQPDPKAKGPDELRVFADQWQALDSFVDKWFHGEDGALIAAFHPFEEPSGFEQILGLHLRTLLERRLAAWGLPTDAASLPSPASWTTGSPFRGLEIFEFAHAPIFFGRTRAVSDVLAALRRQAQVGQAFLLILGGSGCGKSSLVQAGVLPMLVQPGVIEGVGLWRRAIMRPGAVSSSLASTFPQSIAPRSDRDQKSGDLFDALAAALTDSAALPELLADGTSIASVGEMLRKNPGGAYALVKGALSQAAAMLQPAQEAKLQPEARLVLVVDQLEEMFSDKRFTAAAREAFFVALSDLARGGKVWIIATLRSDFYHRCQEVPELAALKGGNGQLELSPPAPTEVGQMIRQPASAAGLQFEVDPLTGQTLDDVLQNEAAGIKEGLPLLEFALDELYRNAVAARAPHTSSQPAPLMLNFKEYRDIKGLAGCLAERAERTFQKLDEGARSAFSKVFRRLVVLDSTEKVPTRRIAPMSEFEQNPGMSSFVDRFVSARLFTADRAVGPEGTATVRVAHEALLTSAEWTRLREWLAHDRENLQMHGRLSAAANRWKESSRAPELLLQRGKPLEESRQLLAAQFELTDLEGDLVAESEWHARRLQLVKRSAIVALLVLTIVAAVVGRLAVVARNDAVVAKMSAVDERENLRTNLRQLAQSHLDTAIGELVAGRHRTGLHLLLLADRTLRDAADPEHPADERLRRTIRYLLSGWRPSVGRVLIHEGQVQHAVFSPDGRMILTASADKSARLWDAETGKPIGEPMPHENPVCAMSFSRDGRRILAGTATASHLWDAASGTPIGRPRRRPHWSGVWFSPDGRVEVAGDGLSTMSMRDVATGNPIFQLQHSQTSPVYVLTVSFSPDGRALLTGGSDSTARLWNAETGQPIGEPLRHDGRVTAASFSPDGRTIVTGSSDRTARLWEAATGKPIGGPLRHEQAVHVVSISPDGHTLLTGSVNTARLWNIATGQPIGQTLHHEHYIEAVCFNPDGRSVLTGSWDSTARLWKAATGQPIGEPLRHDGRVMAVSFSPDGRKILTGSMDGTARVWDAATVMPTGLSMGARFRAGSFNGDRPTEVAATKDTARLWDVATGEPIGEPLRLEEQINQLSFTPDGSAVFMRGDRTARFWHATTGKPIGEPLRPKDPVHSACFSPDSHTVLTTSENTAQLWVADTGKPIGQPLRHKGTIVAAAFSTDNRTVLTGSTDTTARFWEAATGKSIGDPLPHAAGVLKVWFTPDGRTAVTQIYDSLRLWQVPTGHPVGDPLRHKGRIEAVSFSSDSRTVATAGDDMTARLWDTATGQPTGKPFRHKGTVLAVSFGDGDRLILTGSGDRTARIWDVATGKLIGEPMHHEDEVWAVSFSHDACTVATGSSDSTARLWEAATGKPIGPPLRHLETVSAVAYSPDGHTLFTGVRDYQVGFWKIPQPLPDEPDRIQLWIEILSGLYRDEQFRLQPLSLDLLRDRMRRLDEMGGPPESAIDGLEWHRNQAYRSEQEQNWFALVFHLNRLINAQPNNTQFRKRRADGLLKLKRFAQARVD